MSERYALNIAINPAAAGDGFFRLCAMYIPYEDGKFGKASIFHEETIEVAPEARCVDDVLPMAVDLMEVVGQKFLAEYCKHVKPSISGSGAQALDELLTLRYPD